MRARHSAGPTRSPRHRRCCGRRARCTVTVSRHVLTTLCLLFLSGAWAATAHAVPRLIGQPARMLQGPPSHATKAHEVADAAHRPSTAMIEVTLVNAGDSPLTIVGVSLSPDSAGFHIDSDGDVIVPGQTLAPQAQRTVRVGYQAAPGRRQAYGALLIYSDDPRGQDDPRSDARDRVLSIPLCVGESTTLLWLWLGPLACGLLLALLAWRWQRTTVTSRGVLTALATLAGVLPACVLIPLFLGFVRDFGVLQGNFGYQFLYQRVLSVSAPLSYHAGIDGLSLLLALVVALWSLVRSPGLALRLWQQPTWPDPTDPQRPQAVDLLWQTLTVSGSLGLIVCLDAVPLMAFFATSLLGLRGLLPISQRRLFSIGAAGSLLALGLALSFLVAHSGPTTLSSGHFVQHTTDLVKLSYQNYFADLTWPMGWSVFPVAPALYVGLSAGLLAPLVVLAYLALRAPLLLAAAAVTALPIAALVGFYLWLRVLAGALPQAHSILAPGLASLLLLSTAAAALLPRVARPFPCIARVPALPLLLPIAAAFLGVASATATGILAALLQLGALSVTAGWLGHRLSRLPARAACSPCAVPKTAQDQPASSNRTSDRASDRASDWAGQPSPEQAAAPVLRLALLGLFAPPGTLTFLLHGLVALSAFANLRSASVLFVALWLLSQAQAVAYLWTPTSHVDGPRRSLAVEVGRALILASAVACFCTRPIVELGHTWSQDFISHTRHVSGPPGPGLIAHK